MKRWRHPNLGFWSQCHLLIKTETIPCQSLDLGFWSQCHLLIKWQKHPDQKAGTPKGGDTLIKRQRHPKVETPWSKGGDTQLRLLKSVSLADQKLETSKGGDTPIKRWRHWNLGFWSQCHLLIKGRDTQRWRHSDQKVETPKLKFLKSVSLADQKADTPWSKGRDTLIKRQRHPDKKAETPKLRFLKLVSLADQKVETTPHPKSLNLGFWSQCHLLIKGRDTERWRHSDQKVETPKLKFLKSVSLADQKAETPWSKGRNTLMKRWRHPNLGFWSQCHLLIKAETIPCQSLDLGFWSQCHLLIKWQKHPDQKAETPKGGDTLIKRQRHPKVETPWSKGGDTQLRLLKSVSLADQKLETPKGGDTPIKRWRHWNLGFWSQCHLLIKGRDTQRWRHSDQKVETPKLKFLKSVSLADQKADTPWSKGRDTLIKRQRHPDKKAETPKLRFLKLVSLADQKVETTPHPKSLNLGFWSQCHLLIKGRDTERWRHSDQKVETPKLKFLKSVSLADQKAETPRSKGRDILIKRWRHPDQKVETPKCRFLKSASLADQKAETPKLSLVGMPKHSWRVIYLFS